VKRQKAKVKSCPLRFYITIVFWLSGYQGAGYQNIRLTGVSHPTDILISWSPASCFPDVLISLTRHLGCNLKVKSNLSILKIAPSGLPILKRMGQ
jgi:hypothetical protein